jgi:prepilin peptidase CpaA
MVLIMAGIALGLLTGAAVWTDVRSRRIPNRLTVVTLLTGLALRVPFGWESVSWGLTAAGLAFAFGFLFYLIGGLGGGDVKLMAALATFLEPDGLLIGMIAMALVGGIMAVFASWRAGKLKSVLTNVWLFIITAGKDSLKGWKGQSPMTTLTTAGQDAVTNPYAIAIAAGALVGWLAPIAGWSI